MQTSLIYRIIITIKQMRYDGETIMPQIIASTYEIIKKLGAGGGGNVYLAQHLRLKKKVVLKVDKRKLSAKQEFLRREVDILKELSHPHIPRVYDFFVEGEAVYTVMDYIEGESLDKALKRGEKFSQAQVIQWACQLLDALFYLHNPVHGDPPKGFVHSDIKPANLMRTQQGNICLIDFNIALALGEENVIGCSLGYASPEHYGLDFSSRYDSESGSRFSESVSKESESQEKDTDKTLTLVMHTLEEDAKTITMPGSLEVHGLSSVLSSKSLSGSSDTSRKRLVIPDIRSDIYSVGATLYHLLSGKRPSKNATEVIPLPAELISPQIVRIISKAMNPNPDFRYQTADEMKREFLDLRRNDPRMRSFKRCRRIAAIVFPAVFLIGGMAAFTGLKRMQSMEKWLRLTEYAQTALDKGDVEEASGYIKQVLTESSDQFMPEHVPGIQRVLADAAGVYDLSDGYKMYKTIELPSAPHYMAISPDGKNAAALCGSQVVVFDTVSAKTMVRLPAGTSSISEIKYLNEDVILYAGKDGMKAYDLKRNCELWTGEAATSISVSADGKTAAGIQEGDTGAVVYDAETGNVKCKIDFAGNSQSIGIKDNLFALNGDGFFLAVSFKDGALKIFDLRSVDGDKGDSKEGVDIRENGTVILRPDSGYTHFEGGFSGQYLAFSVSGQEKSTFAVIDIEKGVEAGGFQEEEVFGVQADEEGIYVKADNILVKIDPITGEQIPLADMDENILRFAKNGEHTLVTTENEMYFFNEEAQLMSHYKKEYVSDLIGIAGKMAVVGSMDRPVVRIMRYEENPETEIFSYDPGYQHDEARVSADGKTVMLFSYRQFRVYGKSGKLIKEVEIPDADMVIDQQFIRDGDKSYLEVLYDSGKCISYSAEDGSILDERSQKKLDRNSEESRENGGLDEEFIIDGLRIESPLHGTPTVYDKETGEKIAQLKEDTYLIYVTKAGGYMAAQYVAVDGEYFGQLLSKECEVLAELPYLRDIAGDRLIFDYPAGSIREVKIYETQELIDIVSENR